MLLNLWWKSQRQKKLSNRIWVTLSILAGVQLHRPRRGSRKVNSFKAIDSISEKASEHHSLWFRRELSSSKFIKRVNFYIRRRFLTLFPSSSHERGFMSFTWTRRSSMLLVLYPTSLRSIVNWMSLEIERKPVEELRFEFRCKVFDDFAALPRWILPRLQPLQVTRACSSLTEAVRWIWNCYSNIHCWLLTKRREDSSFV